MRLGDILKARGRQPKAGGESGDGPAEGTASRASPVAPGSVCIPIASIRTNPQQPRTAFSDESLGELAESIRQHGVLQPIVVRRREDGFELVVGERRLRACQQLGWDQIPAIVREVPDEAMAALALIENLQREGLNVLEEARAYQRLLDEFGLTQEELARQLGRRQSTVANKLRLLRLPEPVQGMISREILSERHARALLGLVEARDQIALAREIEERGLSVRATEERVRGWAKRQGSKKAGRRVVRVYKDKELRLFRNSLRRLLQEAERGGLRVVLEEQEQEDGWEFRVVIRRPDRQE